MEGARSVLSAISQSLQHLLQVSYITRSSENKGKTKKQRTERREISKELVSAKTNSFCISVHLKFPL